MEVTLIGHTVPTMAWDAIEPQWAPGYDATGSDRLVEFAGRACYQSWSNPSGRDNAAYLSNIISQGHFSVLEHATAVFYVQGISRALTHELVRHRHLSYSQLSQRFVDEAKRVEFVVPPALEPIKDEETRPVSMFDQAPTYEEILYEAMGDAMAVYKTLLEKLEEQGLTRKQAREAARCVLPNMTETKIVVSGNLRAWRDFLSKRYSTHADAEICRFAGVVLELLRRIAPNSFQDFGPEPAA